MRLSLVPIIKDDTHSVLSSALMNGGIQAIDRISSEVYTSVDEHFCAYAVPFKMCAF
jgi:hypothetical protein